MRSGSIYWREKKNKKNTIFCAAKNGLKFLALFLNGVRARVEIGKETGF